MGLSCGHQSVLLNVKLQCCWNQGDPEKKTIQLSQNEQAASNFAAFSEIFASYSGFRFKTTQVYTSAAFSSTTIVKHFDWA